MVQASTNVDQYSASRVREHLLEDPALNVRYKDLPDEPIDDPTRWMAAKGWGKSGR